MWVRPRAGSSGARPRLPIRGDHRYGHIVGGLLPLLPYMALPQDLAEAFRLSVICTLAALTVFGDIKGRLLGAGVLRSALQTTLIGDCAAAVASPRARVLGGH